MRGFPKHLNTKQDYENCLKDYPEETKAKLKNLLESRFIWQDKEIIKAGNEGIEDSTHRVVEIENHDKMQQELVEDVNAEIFRLGLTVEEVEGLIND